jgi:hypothetical protein
MFFILAGMGRWKNSVMLLISGDSRAPLVVPFLAMSVQAG